jgi:hypothetical protein
MTPRPLTLESPVTGLEAAMAQTPFRCRVCHEVIELWEGAIFTRLFSDSQAVYLRRVDAARAQAPPSGPVGETATA